LQRRSYSCRLFSTLSYLEINILQVTFQLCSLWVNCVLAYQAIVLSRLEIQLTSFVLGSQISPRVPDTSASDRATMMRLFLAIRRPVLVRHPVLLASRAFASRGSNRLHQTAVSRYADDNAPSSAHSGSAKNKPQTEIDNTADESARTLQQNEAKGKTQMDEKDAMISASKFSERDAEISQTDAKLLQMISQTDAKFSQKISLTDAEVSRLREDTQQMFDTLQRPIYSYLLFKANWNVIRNHISHKKHRNNNRERKELLKKLPDWSDWGYGSENEMR
jgi:predicted transcriptional regulator